MENIGLSTAPSGIGSGEAQIVKFDKTLAGLAAKQKAEAKAKADADKELKNTLDKISIDGIHRIISIHVFYIRVSCTSSVSIRNGYW